MDPAAGGPSAAEDRTDQEGDHPPERQARCPETQGCKTTHFHKPKY